MEVYVIQSKNGSIMNIDVSAKVINPNTCDCVCKIDEYLDIKNCSCIKRQIDKSVLEREDEVIKNN